MSIGPILPGRLPGSLVGDRLNQSLQQDLRLLQQLQDQISTGQKFFVPGESPAAAIRTIVLQKSVEHNIQLTTNIATDRSFLQATEASLSTISEALHRANALALQGVGSTSSLAEKQALSVEAATLVHQVINAANSTFQGRFLFGGSQTDVAPFELLGNGMVRYRGDDQALNSFVDTGLLLANNVDGQTAFGAVTPPVGSDINPALTLDTKVSDLLGGLGVTLGSILVTLNNGTPEEASIDLTGAETIRDIKIRIEAAFPVPPGSLTVTVDVDPGSNFGLRLTPSAGTVAIADLTGSSVAADLGIASAAMATINGGDLNPRLTLLTPIAALNGGTGIGSTGGNTFLLTKDSTDTVVNVATATTIEDLFNLMRAADLDIQAGINAAGNGLAISSRLSGALFSIGENSDSIAADLGIRTLIGSTLLADLNRGNGVPVEEVDSSGNLKPALLNITRRNGNNVSIDLKGLKTVQQVLNTVNAVDPGVLVASLNMVGNGITISDKDSMGAGPLTIEENLISTALGIDGVVPGGMVPTVSLVGRDVNPLEADGVLNLLLSLQLALANADDQELARLNPLIIDEVARFNLVRGSIGSRLRSFDEIENRLKDEEILLRESLSVEFDTNITEVLTQLAFKQSSLQATLQVAATTLQLNLFNFL